MAIATNTYQSYDAKGLREDLSNAIYRISPEETPFFSSIGTGPRARAISFDWQTDELKAADGSNAVAEGEEFSFEAATPSVRLANICQILRAEALVSGSLEAVDKAGRASEMAYQMELRSAEIKRDLETILLSNQAADMGGWNVPRRLAALLALVKTNVDEAADGASPVYTAGVPGDVRTDGMQRPFTEALLKNVLQSMFTEGGRARVLMVGPFNKQQVSGFSGEVTRNFDQSNVAPSPTAIIASADVYVGDFDTVRVIPNRFQRPRDAHVLDWRWLAMRWLRPFFTKRVPETGDAMKRVIIGEGSLEVKQEKGLGLIADLTTA